MGNKRKFVEIDSSSSSSSWDYLPDHLLDSVLDRLTTVSDYVQFAAVCKQWFSAARFHHVEWQLKSNPKQLPMLLIPTDDASETHRRICSISGKELNLKNNKQLHVPYNRRCCGSSFGWLIFSLENFTLILYNPFTGATINLPPFIKECNNGMYNCPKVQKAVLSEDPGLFPDTYQVLVLHRNNIRSQLYMFNSGSDSWTHITPPEILLRYYIDDIIYYQGKFYLAGASVFSFVTYNSSQDGLLASIEIVIGKAYHLKLHKADVRTNMQRFYLAESSNGDLLYIGKGIIYDEDHCRHGQSESFGSIKVVYSYISHYTLLTRGFRVYKLKLNIQDQGDDEDDQIMQKCEFELQSSLDGESIFLGVNHPISISACNFPECQPHCIYYTDDEFTMSLENDHGAIDIGVNKHLYETVEKYNYLPPPIWIVPHASFTPL